MPRVREFLGQRKQVRVQASGPGRYLCRGVGGWEKNRGGKAILN